MIKPTTPVDYLRTKHIETYSLKDRKLYLSYGAFFLVVVDNLGSNRVYSGQSWSIIKFDFSSFGEIFSDMLQMFQFSFDVSQDRLVSCLRGQIHWKSQMLPIETHGESLQQRPTGKSFDKRTIPIHILLNNSCHLGLLLVWNELPPSQTCLQSIVG